MHRSQVNPFFWKGKKVFLTGHTGFKGGWMSLWLVSMGANVTGYSLSPKDQPNLFDVLNIKALIQKSYFADIRDLEHLKNAMMEANPDIVIHMAAQPLVRYSYLNPVETYAINVMGTVHVLESARHIKSICATIIVTTDKCYENKEWAWGYRENDPMGGYDPYSNSKGCAELVTSAFRQSFFLDSELSNNKVASVRAGNVIGGGDWSEDRLIPDAIRAFESGKPLKIRNPLATRPWQHVLEPLSGYLTLAQALYDQGSSVASSWNFGPNDEDNQSVQEVVDLFAARWGNAVRWEKEGVLQPHEAHLLKLDCSKARIQLGWAPKWRLEAAIQKVADWHKDFAENKNMVEVSMAQINEYMSDK